MSSDAPRFLTLDQVQRLHRMSLDDHGGMDGMRDPGGVASALAAAVNTWLYRGGDLHLVESQAFLDGNKRTAIASALTFLAVNGAYVTPSQTALYDAMIAIAERRLDKAGLAGVLRRQMAR